MRALVLGHFSTVGDIECLEWVGEVLTAEAIPFDVAAFMDKIAKAVPGAMSAHEVDPARYTHLIVVCGPLWPGLLQRRGPDLRRFAHCTRIGLNLTMVEPLEAWNPFHLLLERDSDRSARPDLTFLRPTGRVPVVGVCTIARQKEYGADQRHGEALRLIGKLVKDRSLAAVPIDTRWPASRNDGGLGSPAQVISVIERMDVLLTNRLHGLVFALKAGVPVLAIDPVEGGDKVTAQAGVLGWPAVTTVDDGTAARLEAMLDWCLSDEGRTTAKRMGTQAREQLSSVEDQFRHGLREPLEPRPVAMPPVRLTERLKRVLGR